MPDACRRNAVSVAFIAVLVTFFIAVLLSVFISVVANPQCIRPSTVKDLVVYTVVSTILIGLGTYVYGRWRC